MHEIIYYQILTLHSHYIFSLRFLCNKDRYIQNLDIYGRNTRYGSNFHYPTSDLAFCHKNTYYMGLIAFDSLPSYIRDKLQVIKEFK
jgi:hypothetical protein